MTLDKNLKQRIKAFMPLISPPSEGEAIELAVIGNQHRYEEALNLLTDMVISGVTKIETKHGEGNILEFIRRLKIDSNFSESDANKIKKYESMLVIAAAKITPTSDSSYFHAAHYLSDLKDPLSRARLWRELLEDKSADGIYKLAKIAENLRESASLQFRDGSTPFNEAERKKCVQDALSVFVDVLSNEASEADVKTAAYIGLTLFARQQNMMALKALFELKTPQSYDDAKNILLDTAYIFANGYAHNVPKNLDRIVYDALNTPEAKRALVQVALERYDYACEIREHMKARVGNTVSEDEFADFERQFIATYKKMLVDTLELCRAGNAPLDSSWKTYKFGGLDPETSLNILMLCPANQQNPSHEQEIIGQIKGIASSIPELKDAALDALIARGTYPSLYVAIDSLILEAQTRGEQPEPEGLQDKKKALVAKMGLLNDRMVNHSHRIGLYFSIALLPQVANDEITKAVISALIAQGEYFYVEKMTLSDRNIHRHTTPGYHEETGQPIQYTHRTIRKNYDCPAVPQYAGFALQTLIDTGVKKSRGLQCIRVLANAGDEAMGKKAIEYFLAVNTQASLDQIRLLNRADSVAYYVSLPPEKAVPALEKAFVQNPFGSMKALLDMRAAAVNQGVNDLGSYDAALLVGLTKLADKHRLRKEIEAGNFTQLDVLFTNVAKIGLPDLRTAFKFALQAHQHEKDLAVAQTNLESSLRACNLK